MNTNKLDLPSRQYICPAQRIEFAAQQISEAAPHSKANIFTILDWAQEHRLFLLVRYVGEAYSPTRKFEAEKAFKQAVLKALESEEAYLEKNKEAAFALVDCLNSFDLRMFSPSFCSEGAKFINDLLLAAPMLSRIWLEDTCCEAYRWAYHCDLNGYYALSSKDAARLASADNQPISFLLSIDARLEQTGVGKFETTSSEYFFVPSYVVKRENLYISQTVVHSIIETLNSERQAKEPAAQPAERSRPEPMAQHWEQEILRVIKGLGYDPLKLPKRLEGKDGVKKEVRAMAPPPLKNSESAFNKAWQRLRNNGIIKD